jgi:NADH-quinone oxidoreductase subunit H
LWFFLKLFGLIFLFIWLRGTLPRLRMDQLMVFAWKFMLPMTLINVVVAGLWHFSWEWAWPGGIVGRWLICGVLLAIPYVLLARAVQPKVAKRVYRYA